VQLALRGGQGLLDWRDGLGDPAVFPVGVSGVPPQGPGIAMIKAQCSSRFPGRANPAAQPGRGTRGICTPTSVVSVASRNAARSFQAEWDQVRSGTFSHMQAKPMRGRTEPVAVSSTRPWVCDTNVGIIDRACVLH
jgi:hypothetical protein